MKNKLTIIIPVHTIDDSVYSYLEKSLGSLLNQKKESENINAVVVIPAEHIIAINKFIADKFPKQKSITILVNSTGDYSFQSQINFAAENITSEYFTILEFDDELANTYSKTFDNYVNKDNQFKNIDILMPIIVEVDKDGNAFKLTNNLIWSKQLAGTTGKMGYLNIDALKEHSDFKISGSIIKRETFLVIGGLKKNIKLSFTLEFLLRLINFGYVAYNIPKTLYLHVDGRDNSLFEEYKKLLSLDERKFWFETAYKEYFFQNDRFVQYIPKGE